MTKENFCHLTIRVDVVFAPCDFGLSPMIFLIKNFYDKVKSKKLLTVYLYCCKKMKDNFSQFSYWQLNAVFKTIRHDINMFMDSDIWCDINVEGYNTYIYYYHILCMWCSLKS